MDKEVDMKAFGKHLAKLRKRVLMDDKQLSQERLAGMLGLSTQQVRKYESGENKPSPLTLRKLCDIFGVSGNTLLLLKEGSLQMNYDQLAYIHKEQVKDNIQLLLTMEGREWKEPEGKKTADPENSKKKVL